MARETLHRPDRPVGCPACPDDDGSAPRPVDGRWAEGSKAGPQRLEPGRGGRERGGRVLELVAIARGEAEIPEGEGIDPAIREVRDPLDVARRLCHLLTADLEERAVDPQPGRRPTDERRRLGDLVLVMRKDVVDPTGVDV